MKKYRRSGRGKPAPYVPWAGVQKLIAPAQVVKPKVQAVELSIMEPEPGPPPAPPAPESDLLARIRRAGKEAEAAWWYAEAGYPEELAADESALAQAVAAGQEAMRGVLETGQEHLDGFTLAEQLFDGFEHTWDLTPAQAAALDRLFAQKGPVLVRTRRGWYSAGEWAERLELFGGGKIERAFKPVAGQD
ncbi:hypothetical protein G7K71_02965 [Desulfofundulus sp. TPOSR]|uniref:hypothetical protein n=1 Tax=Desulfofundulus sp. TPOSR TaxID=2714340 RepID=UPI0014090028|nr:hypothetical protein [Desulfofundulus sp. TPOSR]NHM25988.1 hypothetical protein [Desulfofundulus sp. TPOSR]